MTQPKTQPHCTNTTLNFSILYTNQYRSNTLIPAAQAESLISTSHQLATCSNSSFSFSSQPVDPPMEHSPDRICYVQCNYCNTILAVSVPYGSMLTNCSNSIVTVRCGHCENLLCVNVGLLHLHSLQELQDFQMKQASVKAEATGGGSSSKWSRFGPWRPKKRQRVPSAYNRFIKDEIQRIKASNPAISHREAFSTAAKNWAHFPDIHFGRKLDANKEENAVAGKGTQ